MDASDFLRGGCYALALWLHRKTDLPLYGLFDEHGEMHHAMVAGHDGDTVYDARGRVPASLAHMLRGRACAGREFRETTVDEVEAMRSLAARLGGVEPSDRQVARFARQVAALCELVETGPVPAPGPRM